MYLYREKLEGKLVKARECSYVFLLIRRFTMEIYRFSKEVGKKIVMFHSDFIMSRIITTDNPVHIGCMHLESNGTIGYHKAVESQLLLIVSGEGKVRGAEDRFHMVSPGDAVFWEKGEWHETVTDLGLMAIIIEGEQLHPSDSMQKKYEVEDSW